MRNPTEHGNVDRIVRGVSLLSVGGLEDYEQAAALHPTCRRQGETVRRMTGCLITAVAIRNDVPVLHHDSDFEVRARHTPLQLA